MARIDDLKELYSATFPSSKVKRKKIIDTIINKISGTPISLKIKNHELYLVIDEAVSNAMEHGNRWDTRKNITAKISIDNSNLIVSIEDEGSGFDPDSIIKKNESTMPGGRGIQIIKHFCNMKWNNKGNVADLIFKLQ
jgi:serine/threonine-protein kinase RsbW